MFDCDSVPFKFEVGQSSQPWTDNSSDKIVNFLTLHGFIVAIFFSSLEFFELPFRAFDFSYNSLL